MVIGIKSFYIHHSLCEETSEPIEKITYEKNQVEIEFTSFVGYSYYANHFIIFYVHRICELWKK